MSAPLATIQMLPTQRNLGRVRVDSCSNQPFQLYPLPTTGARGCNVAHSERCEIRRSSVADDHAAAGRQESEQFQTALSLTEVCQ